MQDAHSQHQVTQGRQQSPSAASLLKAAFSLAVLSSAAFPFPAAREAAVEKKSHAPGKHPVATAWPFTLLPHSFPSSPTGFALPFLSLSVAFSLTDTSLLSQKTIQRSANHTGKTAGWKWEDPTLFTRFSSRTPLSFFLDCLGWCLVQRQSETGVWLRGGHRGFMNAWGWCLGCSLAPLCPCSCRFPFAPLDEPRNNNKDKCKYPCSPLPKEATSWPHLAHLDQLPLLFLQQTGHQAQILQLLQGRMEQVPSKAW